MSAPMSGTSYPGMYPGQSRAAAPEKMNLFKVLVGNCYCDPATNVWEGLSPTVQFVELHGIRFIGLGSVSDELSAQERVYDTLEQLTDRSERLMSIGHVTQDDNNRQITHTIPLDVWNKNIATHHAHDSKGNAMSRPVQNLVEQIQSKDYKSAKVQLSLQLQAQKKNLRAGNNLFLSGITAHNLAVVKILSGDSDGVIELFEEAIALKQLAFGKGHLEVAYSWDELGIQWFARNEFEKALQAFEQAQKGRSTGNEMAMVLNNMACCNFQLKNYKTALLTLQQANQQQANTSKHELDLLYHAIVISNCGYLHLCLKMYDDARSLFEEALLIQQSVLDESHRAIRDTRANLDFTNAFHT